MTTIKGSAAVQSSFLFDRAAETKTEKDILKYIKNVSTTINKPGSLLGKLGLKKEIQYTSSSLLKLNNLSEHLMKKESYQSKSLNAVITKMMRKMPKSSFLDYSKIKRNSQDTLNPVALKPKEEIIFINSSHKVEKIFNYILQTDAYQGLKSYEERRELMMNNNVIIHHDKDLLIVEPKINLFANSVIHTTTNTHHYKTIIEGAYKFAKECHLNIDDTIDQMYRALRLSKVSVQNITIHFVAKEIDNGASSKTHAYMPYSVTEGTFIITKKTDAKVVFGDLNEEPFSLDMPSLYSEIEPPVYNEIAEPIYDQIRQATYAAIDHNARRQKNIAQNVHVQRFAYV